MKTLKIEEINSGMGKKKRKIEGKRANGDRGRNK
jgi:hypothetical protein